MDRVKFYSVNDWAVGYQLQKAEKIINDFDKNKKYTMQEILELYNITKYIDNNLFLKKWSTVYIEKAKEVAKEMKTIVFKYMDSNILNEDFQIILKDVSNQYIDDFFELFEKKIKNINIFGDIFIKSICERNISIYHILQFKKIVKKYDSELRNVMLQDIINSTEIMIRKYYINEEKNKQIELPSSLTNEDKENMLIRYIDEEYANLNYVRIIAKIQSSKDMIEISDKTKLKACRKVVEQENKIFTKGTGIEYGYNVIFDEKQQTEKIEKMEGNNLVCSYSKRWIEENKDDFATLLNNFIYLFDFTDIEGRVELVNKKHETGVFERAMDLKMLKAYNPNSTFNHKKMVSLLQLNAYYEQLNRLNIRLEDIIEWFFDSYLKGNFEIENFSISMPSKDSTFFEKCKSVLPEIDHILKEYKYYVEDGQVDPELVSISSEHMFFKDITSKVKDKYVYLKNSDYNNLIDYYFFSDQCMLAYLENLDNKYDNFFKLIVKEDIKYNDFPEYDKKDLDWLIKEKLIFENDKGLLKIKNEERIMVYAELHYKEVISYWRKSEKIRNEIKQMIKENRLEIGSSLFSRNEQDYFNFYLNMSEFIDGYDIRNSNLHGTQIGDRKSDVHYSRYLQIVLLIVLIIIKINDDICLSKSKIYLERSKDE